jgi:hypothetical protein
MPKRDAQVFEMLVGQACENALIDITFDKVSLVLGKAE